MLYDTAGRAPLGVVHWLAYGIPASKTGFKEGEASQPANGLVGGKSLMGLPTYFGPCPPKGVKAHPYVFTLMATDLAPDALSPGRTRPRSAPRCRGTSSIRSVSSRASGTEDGEFRPIG